MDSITLKAEALLKKALEDSEGYLYPNSIDISKNELQKVFKILTPYGKELIGEHNGASPIFKINDYGRAFIASGAWSEKERNEKIDQERHNEIMEQSRNNNMYAKISIIVDIIMKPIGYIVSIFSTIMGNK